MENCIAIWELYCSFGVVGWKIVLQYEVYCNWARLLELYCKSVQWLEKLYCNTLQCRIIVLQECAVAEICIAIA